MNAADLRAKSAGDLRGELAELRREQFNLRMQRGAGQLANPMRFGAVRKDIARIKTVLAEKARADGAARPQGKEGKESKAK
ncbi:MAG: 50S ribosomal protein L29 [Gammaproteobacteria bacterium]|nr:50S ribosomal protein L29 [Gammaproteobacteria bacterium]